jgi:hypothetical protein
MVKKLIKKFHDSTSQDRMRKVRGVCFHGLDEMLNFLRMLKKIS